MTTHPKQSGKGMFPYHAANTRCCDVCKCGKSGELNVYHTSAMKYMRQARHSQTIITPWQQHFLRLPLCI